MSLREIKEKTKNQKIKIIDGSIFENNSDSKDGDEKNIIKPIGRPKKDGSKVCDKKVMIYFTEEEFNNILQKTGSIAMSPFLKRIILDSLK